MENININKNEKKFYTVEEIAKEIGVYKQNLYKDIANGKLGVLRVGRRVVVPSIYYTAYVYGISVSDTQKIAKEQLVEMVKNEC